MLDSATAQLEGRELIEDIHRKTAFSDRNSTSLTNTLEANIHTVFNSGHKFIYELLQNADDAKATVVQFTLSGSELIVSHNGDPFKPEDVNKLCDNAKSDSYKAKQLDKTGYKGVGFKAVFCITKKVTVISEPYCFRFDQSSWHQTAEAKHPWPIIPIWMDVESIREQLPLNKELKVHFILSNIEREAVQVELNAIFQSTEVLLLLRHVHQVMISPEQIEIKKSNQDDLILLERYEEERQVARHLWITQARPIEIPPYIKEAIKSLSAAECPDKLKEASTIDLIFAASVTRDADGNLNLAAMDNARIYCYLPTQVTTGLPYLINAHFLLNQDRTLLMNNAWNRFLLKQIAAEQFGWLKSLAANSRYSKSILNLLAPHKLMSVEPELNMAYQEGYYTGITNTNFIPSLTGGRLLYVRQAHIDRTQFFKHFNNEFQDNNLRDAEGSCVISYALTSVEKLIELKNYGFKIQLYDYEALLNRLEDYLAQTDPLTFSLAIRLLIFFKDQQLSSQNLDLLRQRETLLCGDNKRRQPERCYLAEGDLTLAQQFELAMVHPKIMENRDLTNWLHQTLAVSKLNKIEIIRSSIVPWIKSGEIKTQDPIQVLRFIYSAVREGVSLSDKDYHSLQLLPVVRRDKQLAPINTVHIPSFDDAPQNIPNNLILADDYFQTTDDNKIWKLLLIRMGIRTEIGLTLHHSPNSTNAITVAEISAYFALHKFEPFVEFYTQLKAQHGSELHYNSPSEDAKLVNFITYDFLPQLNQDLYYTLFWQAFRANWQQLQQTCLYDKNLSKKSAYKPFEIPHYLVYFLQKYPCIRVIGRTERKKVSEVYSPALLITEEVKDLPLLIADIPGGLTLEQARFLGIKTRVSFEDCLDLLSKPQCQKPQQLNLIYHWLLLYKQQLDTSQLAHLKKWLAVNTLLATNHTQQRVQSLCYFDLPGDTPEGAGWLHQVNLSAADIFDLVELFNIPRASQQQLNNFDAQDDKELSGMINNALSVALPILAMLEKRSAYEDAHTILKRMLDCYYQIDIYSCKKLVINEIALRVFNEGNKLYISGRWADRYLRKHVATALGKHYFRLSPNTSAIFEDMLGSSSIPELESVLAEFHLNQKIYDELHSFLLAYRPAFPEAVTHEIGQPALVFNTEDNDYPDDDDIKVGTDNRRPPNTPSINTSPADGTNPGVVPGSLFYSPINLFKNNSTPTGRSHPAGERPRGGGRRGRTLFPTQPTAEQQEEFLVRGKLGERQFYDYLRQSAENKGWTIQDTDSGFFACHDKKTISIEWPNKNKEDYQPLDFKVTYNEHVYVFEVKSTKYPKKDFVNLSTHEWENMIKFKNDYALVCIFDVESKRPTFDVIWNIFRKIVENSMKPDNMILRWGYNTQDQMLVIPDGVEAKDFVGKNTQAEYEQCRMQ